MNKYAGYRIFYGEDFIQESIRSIEDYFDKIFIFWTDKALGGVTGCVYKDETIKFPKPFDNVMEKIRELNHPKVELIEDYVYNNVGQFTHWMNDIILPNYDKPDYFMFIEADHVFRTDQIELALIQTKQGTQSGEKTHGISHGIELWRYPSWRIPSRPKRGGVVIWNMTHIDKVPKTSRHACGEGGFRIGAEVHDFSYAVSERNMYWQHLCRIAFSRSIKDSPPAETWYDEKWFSWDPLTNNENLAPSKRWSHTIPNAIPYNINELPDLLKGGYNHDL